MDKTFERGENIFKQGEPADCAYYIQSGLVLIWVEVPDGYHNLVELGPGSIFGELGVLDGEPRIANATARDPTVCSVITKQRFDRYLVELEPMASLVLRSLLTYVRASIPRLRDACAEAARNDPLQRAYVLERARRLLEEGN